MPTPTTTLALTHPPESTQPSSGLNFNDLLFIFYRHKIKITLFILIGAISAAAIYFLLPAPFESQAKLLVRYVVERSAVDGAVGGDGAKGGDGPSVGAPSEAIINSEVEILTSSDLARQVAETIGSARLLDTGESPLQPLFTFLHLGSGKEKPKPTLDDATIALRKALEVKAVTGSNIISVTYTNKDPKLTVAVLDQFVQRYLEKHLEVHRSMGTFNYISKETERIHAELTKTETDLKKLKEANRVTTIAETITLNAADLAKARNDLETAQSDLASQKVTLQEIDKSYQGQSIQTSTPPDTKTINEYQGLIERVEAMRKDLSTALSRYAPGSRMVKIKQAPLDALEKEKVELERKYPALIVSAATTGSGAASAGMEITLKRGQVAGLETRVTELSRRIGELQARETALSNVAPKITELERMRDVQEASFRYYESSLEKARIDEGLNPSRIPNISVVQNPSPSIRATRDLKKVVIGLAGGSVVFGLALALFIELVLDRTVKRARELETRLRLPLMLTIPDFGGRLRLPEHSGDAEAVAETSGEFLRPFCEAIRDRLGLFFELDRMEHKPKLVAVTGLSDSAGVSSLAAGLADVLTEGGEGKVLLVDKPVNPKRFYSLMKEFKTSDVDYIIFDMPSLGDTSSTLPMASFMDKVLLVVEAEKSGRDSVKKAYAQLSLKTDVSVIFNKSRIYGPKWLEGEL